MKSSFKILRNIIILIIIIINSNGVFAAAASTTFQVTAIVLSACTVTTATPQLNFNSYNSLSSTPTDATIDIQVTCTNGTGYHVRLDAGQTPGATTTTRQMRGTPPTNVLNYFLYSDSGRATNWGNAGDSVPGTGTGGTVTHTVYGRIPINQTTVPAGSYSDTIAVSITIP